MNEPHLPLWTKDNSDVLPEYQLTFGHALFRGLPAYGWTSKLIRLLGLNEPIYSGPLQQAAIPRHASRKYKVLGAPSEVHLLFARLDDVWSVFGPHELFFGSKKWILSNLELGGLMAFVTQMDSDCFSYRVFEKGMKQTNVFAEGSTLRIAADTQIVAFMDERQVFDGGVACSLTDKQVLNFIEHDAAISARSAQQLSISPRFNSEKALSEEITHVIVSRAPSKKSLLGRLFR
jgi:hypothetical protein